MVKKSYLLIILILTACTMRMPPIARARFVVEHYLDSVYKPNKVELMKFIEIEGADIDNSEIIKRIKEDSIKTDSEKQNNKELLNSANDVSTPNGFYCDYRISGVEYVSVFRLDDKLLRVVRVTESHQ